METTVWEQTWLARISNFWQPINWRKFSWLYFEFILLKKVMQWMGSRRQGGISFYFIFVGAFSQKRFKSSLFQDLEGRKSRKNKTNFFTSIPTVFERISILKRTERKKGRKKERFSVIILCRKTGKLEIKKFEIK